MGGKPRPSISALLGLRRMSTWLLAALWLAAPVPAPQAPAESPRKADSVIGEVTAVDGALRRLTVKSDAGASVEVRLDDKTVFLRARPGSTGLNDATPAHLEEIAAGDRVLARGRRADDKASLAARQVVLMTRSDIAQKQDSERADWRRRGVLGVVSAVDATKGEIILQVRRLAGAETVTIPAAGPKVVFRRYAPDSVKFGDARPSSLVEVQVGDQLRALGERSPDGSRLVPEQVVFGTFRTVSGPVAEVDASTGELTVRDEQSRKPVRIAVGSDARLRRIPPEMGARLARWREGPGPDGPARPEGPAGNGTAPGAERFRGMREGGGPEDILDRLPAITLAELKPGDRILVSSTKGNDPAHLTAIALVAGLEALAPPAIARGRGARGMDSDLPPELMDLGMSIP